MRSLRTVFWCLVISGVFVPNSLSAAAPSMDVLLPKTTVGFISALNFPRLTAQWNKTQLGNLMKKAEMKPFEEDLHEQMQSQWAAVSDRLGIQLDDLRGVPTAEAALAMIRTTIQTSSGPEPGAATTLLMDVTGNANSARALLNKAQKGLLPRGAKQKVLNVQGVQVFVFDVPLPAALQAAAGAAGAAAAPAATSLTVYFLTDSVFCACDDLNVTKDIIGRHISGRAAGSLSQVSGYQKVMKRCAADPPAHDPNIKWFMYPLGYAEATRAATPADKRRRGKTIIEIMRNQGYSAFQGAGGFIDVSADGYQILHRTAVYAPKPWEKDKSINMFVFPVGANFTPQPWVGRDIATYFTAYVDPLTIFDNFGPLYDEILDAKVWQQTIDQMINDKDGPQINIRKELIAQLGQRVTMVADYRLPITTTSERLLWAIEVKDAARVAKAIEKCVNGDPSFKKRTINGQVIWEIVEEEDSSVAPPTIDVPSLGGPKKEAKPKANTDDDQDKEGHFLPHGAFAVANGQLFIASHIDFLVKALKPIAPADQLATQKEFLKVWDLTFNQLGVKQQTARSFSWSDRAVQPTYELIKQGKMPQSESLLGRTLNSLSAAGKKGAPRQQKINGAKLPDFATVVAPALGPATASMTAEKDGWFVKGVLVTK